MRLIDKDYAVDTAWSIEVYHGSAREVCEMLEEAPTVDAVPVIRCKDCKYWMPHMQFGYDEDSDKYHNYCKMHLPDDDFYAFIKEAEDYCSWAERKEE